MRIILDLNGWKKDAILGDKIASKVAKTGYITVGLTKPLDILAKDSDIRIEKSTGIMSLDFRHYGMWIDNKPIYKYMP